MESSFIPVHYLYNYYMVCVLSSHASHVTWSCDVMLWHPIFFHVTVTMWHLWYDTFLYFLYNKSKRKRKRKGNINNDLAILLSYDRFDNIVMIDLIASRCSIHGLLLCFTLLHISNGSVSISLVGYVLYLVDLMSAACIPHFYLMVYRYIQ